MTLTDGIRVWFLVLFGLGFVGTIAGYNHFFRSQRKRVEKKIGPLPTPGPFIVSVAGLLILLTRVGEMSADLPVLRLLGVGLSLYFVFMMQWGVRTIGGSGAPGAAIYRDHRLITSGPFRLVCHPGYSATMGLWLGAALGTLNWLLLALSPLLLATFLIYSGWEEQLLRQKFGASYETYAAQTARLIPRLW